jgi:hypothetical protein
MQEEEDPLVQQASLLHIGVVTAVEGTWFVNSDPRKIDGG